MTILHAAQHHVRRLVKQGPQRAVGAGRDCGTTPILMTGTVRPTFRDGLNDASKALR